LPQEAAGSTVVVVGDGAVGQCAVIAARRLGADRITAMSRHADRQALARDLGATDIAEARATTVSRRAVQSCSRGPRADAARSVAPRSR
jgi:threonine dehydrogenase-like Zn-dependent dehydrogenase